METFKKTAVQKTRIPESKIFFVRELSDKHFDATWHAHQECQLFMVLEGTGTRFIGNTVKYFSRGDLTLLGPNIPHLWRSDDMYFDLHSDAHSHGLVIYFNMDSLSPLSDKDELAQIKTLFTKMRCGMEIYGSTVAQTQQLMHEILHMHGIASIIQLFKILDLLSNTKDYHLLHDDMYNYPLKDAETNRINLIYNYAAKHFRKKIPLEEVAALLNMTPTSFARYFTMKTSKSFSYFLMELRIRHACKHLTTDEAKSIAQICYESGFNTLSNFNKQFKTYMGMTPKEYRQKFQLL
ncbi:AraC family transcriptional regulator [Parapedobacter tibetensis]|uniref:AraC family transcriptional regulator n=1 Tax=Parapedobacter tibetensis TaxID=2972951 RepID=UPI00214D244B|nr:AraC family transcriptional regulator [Parapedobacter tibetensis]